MKSQGEARRKESKPFWSLMRQAKACVQVHCTTKAHPRATPHFDRHLISRPTL